MEWVRWKRDEQYRITRQRHQSEKKQMNMTMRERNGVHEAWTREQHDRIVAESDHKNKKRDYMNLVKRIGQRRESTRIKEELF